MSENLPACIIEMHGVRITELGLVMLPEARGIDPELDTLVRRWEKAIAWCRGDLAVRYVSRAKTIDAEAGVKARDERHARQMELEHIAAYADFLELNRDKVAEAEEIARFFPHELRRAELSFEHHAEAMTGSKGDRALASSWLDMAIANAWTVSELRAYIRKQNAAGNAGSDDEPPEHGIDRKLSEIELWAAKQLKAVQSIPPSVARAQLNSLRRLVELVETLTRRAHGE